MVQNNAGLSPVLSTLDPILPKSLKNRTVSVAQGCIFIYTYIYIYLFDSRINKSLCIFFHHLIITVNVSILDI